MIGWMFGTTPRAHTPNQTDGSSWCLFYKRSHCWGFLRPSRAAIFTGQYASTTGCYRTANYFANRPDIEPLQVSFSKAGYRTFGAEAFHHPVGAVDKRGWDGPRAQDTAAERLKADSWSEGTPFPKPFPNSIYNQGEQITGGLFRVEHNDQEKMADPNASLGSEQLQRKHDQPFSWCWYLRTPFPNYCPQVF